MKFSYRKISNSCRTDGRLVYLFAFTISRRELFSFHRHQIVCKRLNRFIPAIVLPTGKNVLLMFASILNLWSCNIFIEVGQTVPIRKNDVNIDFITTVASARARLNCRPLNSNHKTRTNWTVRSRVNSFKIKRFVWVCGMPVRANVRTVNYILHNVIGFLLCLSYRQTIQFLPNIKCNYLHFKATKWTAVNSIWDAFEILSFDRKD